MVEKLRIYEIDRAKREKKIFDMEAIKDRLNNLSGEATDASAKYKIRDYDKEYADSLRDDKNFNIVARMMVSVEECKRYCEEEADRGFKAKFWRPITIRDLVCF